MTRPATISRRHNKVIHSTRCLTTQVRHIINACICNQSQRTRQSRQHVTVNGEQDRYLAMSECIFR
ncbi:hypothetical protein PSEUDO8Z_140041 [Pseudomonas sp. 8Z]|nr:hypothetical protein PSEUDO8Z_140041 [Pseudomonas sp. 8Z]